MSRKALVPLNLIPLSAAPTTPTLRTGDIYWDTALAAVRAYTGASWSTLAHLSNANVFTATQQINIPTAENNGLIIRAVASQTADLQQWQTSAGTNIGQIGATGYIVSGGSEPIYQSFTVNSATGNGTTATITISVNHNLAVGDLINVTGVTPTGYNGTYRITAIPSANQISYTNTTTGSLSVAGSLRIAPQLSIYASTTQTRGIVLRSAASTQGNMIELQNSSGTVLSRFNTAGNYNGDQVRLTSGVYFDRTDGGTQDWLLYRASTSASPLYLRDLVNARMLVTFNQGAAGAATSVFSDLVQINIPTAARTGLIVQGAASQTANLQEWQNSSGTVLARVESSGTVRVSGSWGATSLNTQSAAVALYNSSAGDSNSVSLLQGFDQAGTTETLRITSSGAIRGSGISDIGRTVVFSPVASSRWNMTGSLWMNTAGAVIQMKSTDGLIDKSISVLNSGSFNIAATPAATSWTDNSQTILGTYAPNGTTARVSVKNFGNTTIDVNTPNTADTSVWGALVPLTIRHDGAGVLSGDLFAIQLGANTLLNFTKTGWLQLRNSTAPTSNPTSSGYLYVDSGALSYRGTSNAGQQIVGANGTVTYTSPTSALIPLSIKAAVSQTANLQEWQNSSGSTIAYVRNDGYIYSSAGVTGQPFVSAGTYIAGAQLISSIGTATNIGVLVRGAASQSADLQQWQNSAGTILARVDAGGAVRLDTSSTNTSPFGVAGQIRLYNTSNTNNNYTIIENYANGAITSGIAFVNTDWTNNYGQFMIGTRSAAGFNSNSFFVQSGGGIFTSTNTDTNVVARVRGAASQTADLQQWQNSDGTVLSRLDAFGKLSLRTGNIGGSVLSIIPDATTSPGIIIRAIASQTANLQEWQNSAGTALTLIDSGGRILTSQNAGFGSRLTVGSQTVSGSGRLVVLSTGTTDVSIVARGFSGQTANLQEWQNSAGTVLANLNASGDFAGRLAYFGNNLDLSSVMNLSVRTTTQRGLAIRGIASQIADLFQVQTADGTATFTINAEGNVVASNIAGGYIQYQYFRGGGDTASALSLPGSRNVALGGGVGSFGGGARTVFLNNADTVPSSNPTGGGVLYSEAGALKWRGSGGAVTTVALSGSEATTISANTATTVDTVALTSFTTLEYVVSIKQGTKIRSSKVLVQTDGTSVDSTEYGILETGGAMSGVSVTASVSSTNCILTVTITDAATTNATVKILKSIL